MKTASRLLALAAGLALQVPLTEAQPPAAHSATPNWGAAAAAPGSGAATTPGSITWGRPNATAPPPATPSGATPGALAPSTIGSRGAVVAAPAASAKAAAFLAKKATMTPVRIANPRPNASGSMITLLSRQMSGATGERAQILAARQSSSAQAALANAADAPLTRTSVAAPTTLPHGDPNAKLPGSPQAHVLPCQQGKMGVYTMNGAAPAAMVFTPNPQYDLYTFEGCGFGASPGQLTLIGHFKAFKLALVVVDWTDTSIIAALDTSVTGEPDENGNVSLILSRADGQRLQFNGNSFYAARASVTLQSIPQTWATLGPVRDAANLPVTPLYELGSQSSSYVSVTVTRASINRFSGGQDYYDLSHLNPQFSADSLLLYAAPLDCTFYGTVTRYIDGYTTAQWDTQGNILVKLGGTTCHVAGNSNDDAEENYNIVLNITGPRDVDPLQTM